MKSNKANKYNVILMRDDTSVKNFRLSPFWIKFLLLFFVFLLVTSGAGLYYSYIFFMEKKVIAQLYEDRMETFEEMQRELKRLRNVEQTFESYNEEELRSFLSAQRREEIDLPDNEVELDDIFSPVDQNIVGVANVQASLTQDKMRVQLEVNNMEGEGTVSGRIYLFLIQNDGTLIELDLEDDDLYYSIARFKRVDTTFDLPGGVDQESLFALRVSARDDNQELIYSQTYPLSKILL
ncbi:MAG: hypothetical protein ACLFSF_06930 [Desulfonatronovibrio sp.]